MRANSRIPTSAQTGIHERLGELVDRHLQDLLPLFLRQIEKRLVGHSFYSLSCGECDCLVM